MSLSSPQTGLLELQRKIPIKKELDRRLTEQQTMVDSPVFIGTVFAASFDHFVGGAYIDKIAPFLGSSLRIAHVGARDHFESTSLSARYMYCLFRTRPANFEANCLSYEQNMSGYHIEKTKKLIRPNPYFANWRDLKATADSVGAWTGDGEHTVTLDPKSLLSFKRGIHPEWIAVDAPFRIQKTSSTPPPSQDLRHVQEADPRHAQVGRWHPDRCRGRLAQ